MILAIETSCDDTCAAVLDGAADPLQRDLLAGRRARALRRRRPRGRLAPPPRAGRRRWSRRRWPRPAPTLDDVEAVAVTAGPGLIGALLVGVSTAKAIAAPRRLPLIPVDHLQGHVAANFLEPEPLEPPFLCLVASGGHTLLAGGPRPRTATRSLGQTLDDAAGEAFDKVGAAARPRLPGRARRSSALAADGDPEAFELPVAMSRDPGLDFSFSGLKTALVYRCRELGPERRRASAAPTSPPASRRPSSASSIAKLERALEAGRVGGASRSAAASPPTAPLRERGRGALRASGACALKLVAAELCTDNAAMIGSAARFAEPHPYPDYLAYDAFATARAAAA